MRHIYRIGILSGLVAAGLIAQHEKDNEAPKHPYVGDPVRIEAGRKSYLGGCAGCHGPEAGGGRGPSLTDRAAWHPLTDDGLFKTIQKGVGVMPAANLPEERAWELVAFVRSLTAPAFEMKAPGDDAEGQKLFWGSAGCSSCHRIGGRGGFVGPDLSNIGRTSTLPKLRRSILDPDFERTPGFARVSMVLRNGTKLAGLIKDQTNYNVQVQLKDGSLKPIAVETIESMQIQKESAMPDTFKNRLSKDDINNLVSFLRVQGAK